MYVYIYIYLYPSSTPAPPLGFTSTHVRSRSPVLQEVHRLGVLASFQAGAEGDQTLVQLVLHLSLSRNLRKSREISGNLGKSREISGNLRKSQEISGNINEYQWISDEEGKCQPFWLKPRDGLGRRSRAFFRPHKHLGCFESWKKSHARCSARSFINFAMDWKVSLSVKIPSGYLT